MAADFDELIAEAEARPFTGWDFSWLTESGRMTITAPPWDYTERAVALAAEATTMLDMGTGGGEWLTALPCRAPRTIATEAWPPNVSVAGRNLRAVGVPVVRDEGATDNNDQHASDPRGRLPFRDGAFDLVVNRHEAFTATEVARVLAPGGSFLTQHVDGGNWDDYYRLLGIEPPTEPSWYPLARAQVEAAGLTIVDGGTGVETRRFADAGALAWYLSATSWSEHQFTVDEFRDRLRTVHERMPVEAHETRLWLLAIRS